jgi:hypothetical protein
MPLNGADEANGRVRCGLLRVMYAGPVEWKREYLVQMGGLNA